MTLKSPASLHELLSTPQPRPQLLLQSRRDRIPAARQGTDDNPIRRIQLTYNCSGNVTQPTSDSMPVYRASDRFSDYQTNPRSRDIERLPIVFTSSVNDDIGLHRPHPMSHSGVELGSPRHPVLSRQHGA